jgi:hypothetical protein
VELAVLPTSKASGSWNTPGRDTVKKSSHSLAYVRGWAVSLSAAQYLEGGSRKKE